MSLFSFKFYLFIIIVFSCGSAEGGRCGGILGLIRNKFHFHDARKAKSDPTIARQTIVHWSCHIECWIKRFL